MVRTEVARTGAGLVFTVVGAQAVVVGATRIADALDLAGGFVGLTIVAVGTSLPELATALTAARRGETDLVIGNLLGSNIFNSLAVGGIIGFVGPGVVQDEALTGTPMWIMVGVSAAVLVVIVTGRRVVRWEGILLLAAFIAFLLFLPR
jgi:cation:H+ antiporter